MMNGIFVATAAGVSLLIVGGICPAQQELPTTGARSDIRSGQAPFGYEAIAQRYTVSATSELIEMLNSEDDRQT